MKQRAYEVRIVAGELRGRKLTYPADPGLRPTMQRTKASIFDAIGAAVRGATFLDLYAGGGAMGIEALSRGAEFVHFVENSQQTFRYLRGNAGLCDRDRYALHQEEVMRFLGTYRPQEGARTIVYADPPYEDDVGLLLEFYDAIDYPLPEWLVVEHRSRLVLPTLRRLTLIKSKKFGQTIASFLAEE